MASCPPGFPPGRTRCAWSCGRACRITNETYSVSADQEEEYFTPQEIKEKVEDQKLGWKSIFKGGLEKLEVEHIEESLESRAAKEEIRYDFTFYTPTCRYVRVKVTFLFQRIFCLRRNNLSECKWGVVGVNWACTVYKHEQLELKLNNTMPLALRTSEVQINKNELK